MEATRIVLGRLPFWQCDAHRMGAIAKMARDDRRKYTRANGTPAYLRHMRLRPGIYFVRTHAEGVVLSRKILLNL